MENKTNDFLGKRNWPAAIISILCAGFIGLWIAFINLQNQLTACQTNTEAKVAAERARGDKRLDSISIAKDNKYDTEITQQRRAEREQMEEFKETIKELQGLAKRDNALTETIRKKSYRNNIESEILKSKTQKLKL